MAPRSTPPRVGKLMPGFPEDIRKARQTMLEMPVAPLPAGAFPARAG